MPDRRNELGAAHTEARPGHFDWAKLDRDLAAVRAAGHHDDCDGWRSSHRAEVIEGEFGGYAARCEECGWQTTGSFGRREIAEQFAGEHGSEHGGVVSCDLRCKEWVDDDKR